MNNYHSTEEDLNAGIFEMDEDVEPSKDYEYSLYKLSQMVLKTNLSLTTHTSSSSMFSNSSASNSRPSSRLDSLTTSQSTLSSPRPLSRGCFTPSPYFWSPTPTPPIVEEDGVALSFTDLFEEPESFFNKDIESNDESSDEELEKVQSKGNARAPMMQSELEALKSMKGRPITDDMFDSSDDDDCEVQHPFEI